MRDVKFTLRVARIKAFDGDSDRCMVRAGIRHVGYVEFPCKSADAPRPGQVLAVIVSDRHPDPLGG